MSILENIHRIGNITSSNISKLIKVDKTGKGFGVPALTYIEELNIERRLGRAIQTEAYSTDMAWGKFCEWYVYENLLGFEYHLTAEETDMHPTIDFWSGSKDLIVIGKKIAELKCYQPKNFCKYTDAILTQDIAHIRKEFDSEYWQAVSNSIINNTPFAELISFMPYQSELEAIRTMVSEYDGLDEWKYKFIVERPDIALAYIPEASQYKNLNRFEFEVPEEDKTALELRVLEAGKLLISRN